MKPKISFTRSIPVICMMGPSSSKSPSSSRPPENHKYSQPRKIYHSMEFGNICGQNYPSIDEKVVYQRAYPRTSNNYSALDPQYSYDTSDDRFTSICSSNFELAHVFFNNHYGLGGPEVPSPCEEQGSKRAGVKKVAPDG
ncbi:Uncharacterized protein Fot_57343 [Forsythia ovata]|uniref:Uncharacterized protein n=1 Tax=Forsythia ovata TaxID=205694 RepID=A0ABD1NVQ0_9LAMI